MNIKSRGSGEPAYVEKGDDKEEEKKAERDKETEKRDGK